ncbi:MAG: intradiol ring-cleavage dioxygenase [Alphaproteobacteria bacterium]|nr:intradiol ring-cleavage dioxygenase [Alphaproteobacteria bacterium]
MTSRRGFLTAALSVGAVAFVAPITKRAAFGQTLAPTPAQPAGPFYPITLPEERDADLARIAAAPPARGQIAHMLGVIRTTDGASCKGARVEIWQCDSNGRYHHPGDREGHEPDAGFQGYGALVTAADGGYGFRTIHPVPYTGRTPHIHVIVSGPGLRRLVTQAYVAGAPENANDGLFSRLSPEAQARLLVDFKPAPEIEPGALVGRFDIVVERSAK